MNGIKLFLIDYIQRHAHPVNAVLHIVGVPAAFTGVYWMFARDFRVGLALLAGGYLCQIVGHQVQGNEVGEVILVKKVLKRLFKTP